MEEVGSFNPSPLLHISIPSSAIWGGFPYSLPGQRESSLLLEDKNKVKGISRHRKIPERYPFLAVCVLSWGRGNGAGFVTVYVKQSLLTRTKETCPVRALIPYVGAYIPRGVSMEIEIP
jgi:hypothetical protein